LCVINFGKSRFVRLRIEQFDSVGSETSPLLLRTVQRERTRDAFKYVSVCPHTVRMRLP
jgi:hypothetical protein